MIGLVIGWSWRPRWTRIVFLGLWSKLRFAWTLPPGIGARRMWLAFTALSAFSMRRPYGFSRDDHYAGGGMQRNSNFNNTWGRQQQPGEYGKGAVVKKQEKLCNYWVQGNCSFGEKCRYLHSWSSPCFSLLTQLEGHEKVVTGIVFPSGSDKLYSERSVRVWDCQSGQVGIESAEFAIGNFEVIMQ